MSFATDGDRSNRTRRLWHESSDDGPTALLLGEGYGPAFAFTDAVAVLSIGVDDLAQAFERLDRFLDENVEHACIGLLGYDLRDAVEALPRRIVDEFPQPALWVAAFRRKEPVDRRRFQEEALRVPAVHAALDQVALSAREYRQKVARVVEHIRAGDVFQANLTQPIDLHTTAAPRAIFARLCAVSPAPFSAYLALGEGTFILSSSPEEFLLADGVGVRTRPIKGTRPRGGTATADRALLAELLASEKDQAELAMIVDLLRNDLGKVAEPGSVRVGSFPEHASFAQVHHLFATVTAVLRRGTSTGDLLRATFPGGSITGAPKLRSMEILESLEVRRRGVYCGAIGRLAAGGRANLNVAIRTMVMRGGRVRIGVGGGVTADSEPTAEYLETIHKARGMLAALGVTWQPIVEDS
ncbi:MAG: aminodeoxychorismate synthase component I [Planctomycetota bacterium]